MITLTKEWLMKTIAELEEERDATPGAVNEDAANALAAMKLALASLEAEPVAWLLSGGGAKNNVSFDSGNAYVDPLREVTPLYTAPPAPVSVPAAMEMDDDFDSAFEHGKAVGWNAYRAAMLQGAEQPQNQQQNIPENIPSTQFKPVADLYGLTSPNGGETSFTFDAVEARDFFHGGWSVQEYVELERLQEAVSGKSPVIPDGLPTVCAEAYQVVGVMAEALGVFDDVAIQKVMDNLAQQKLVHCDVLPFSLPAAPHQEVTQALAKGMERYGDAMQELSKKEVK